MANGKHIGKILLKIRESECDLYSLPIKSYDRVYFNSNYSYIVLGGLGGFGLELCDWIALRGCRKLIISSSRGIKNNNQHLKIE
jgi:fatty acid synthase, animal type